MSKDFLGEFVDRKYLQPDPNAAAQAGALDLGWSVTHRSRQVSAVLRLPFLRLGGDLLDEVVRGHRSAILTIGALQVEMVIDSRSLSATHTMTDGVGEVELRLVELFRTEEPKQCTAPPSTPSSESSPLPES